MFCSNYAQTYVLHAIVYVLVFGLIVWGFGSYTIHFRAPFDGGRAADVRA